MFVEEIAFEGTKVALREVIGHMKPVRCAKLPIRVTWSMPLVKSKAT